MTLFTVISTTADILHEPEKPGIISKKDSQLIFGEAFDLLEDKGDWLYGRSVIDGYEGHVRADHLSPQTGQPTHIVDAPLTHLYAEPDFKTRPVMALSFLSRMTITGEVQNEFVRTEQGWIFADHVTLIDKNPPLTEMAQVLETALRFIDTPYLYGGRSALGMDCSALVQLSLLRHGIPCPRDSGDQAETIGKDIPHNERRAGDLVFFKGHVGILTDRDHILNASARTMSTQIEKLPAVKEYYKDITRTKRLSP